MSQKSSTTHLPTKSLFALVQSAPPHNLGSKIVKSNVGEQDALLIKDEAGGYQGAETLALHTYRLMAVRGEKLVDVTQEMLPWFKAHIAPIVEQEAKRNSSDATCRQRRSRSNE